MMKIRHPNNRFEAEGINSANYMEEQESYCSPKDLIETCWKLRKFQVPGMTARGTFHFSIPIGAEEIAFKNINLLMTPLSQNMEFHCDPSNNHFIVIPQNNPQKYMFEKI